jgi:hypothetical protein
MPLDGYDWAPAPRRGLHWRRGRWGGGFYKVGPSWVISIMMPRFGLLHWSHWSLRHLLATFPRAFVAYVRFPFRG